MARSADDKASNRVILHEPIDAIEAVLYRALLSKMVQLSRREQSSLLSERGLASLADSIISGTPSMVLKRLELQDLAPVLKEQLMYQATLPEVKVTPPDDGNREPEPGERHGGKVQKVEGSLAPPERTSKAEKEQSRKRKRERES